MEAGKKPNRQLCTRVYQLHPQMKFKTLPEHAYRPEAKELPESNSRHL